MPIRSPEDRTKTAINPLTPYINFIEHELDKIDIPTSGNVYVPYPLGIDEATYLALQQAYRNKGWHLEASDYHGVSRLALRRLSV